MIQENTVVKGYELKNRRKAVICAEGNIGEGMSFPGVGWENEDALLAEYDKRGGLIMKDGQKIATGSFYDFKLRKPRPEPLIAVQEPLKRKPPVTTEELGNKTDAKMTKKQRKQFEEDAKGEPSE